MLRAVFIMCALEAGVPLREVQIAARQTDSGRGTNQLTDVPRVALASHLEDHALQPYLE